jgi:hypothetical protein
MIEFRFICRENEPEFMTERGWFGRESKVLTATIIHRPILQYRENLAGFYSEWHSVPSVVNKEEWITAARQLGEDVK